MIKEYDAQGNLIHSKDSTGYEWWKTFDENGNLINFKDSNRYEEWYEYQDNVLISSEDSNGVIWSVFDDE